MLELSAELLGHAKRWWGSVLHSRLLERVILCRTTGPRFLKESIPVLVLRLRGLVHGDGRGRELLLLKVSSPRGRLRWTGIRWSCIAEVVWMWLEMV